MVSKILPVAITFFWISSPASLLGDEPTTGKLLAKPEAHRTLVNPDCSHCVDESKRRAKELRDDDPVLCWTRGKYDGGAIPVRFFLNPYRVISDTYGVFVYDPDAGYLRGFAPSLDFSFYGWRGGVMVMKHKDGTLYSCLSGVAFEGPRKGDRLTPVATIPSRWGPWLAAYRDTVAYHMFDKYQPVELPVTDNNDATGTRGRPDSRLPGEEKVVGVSLGGEVRAYPISVVAASRDPLVDELSGKKIVLLWHASTETAAAYLNVLDGDGPTVAVDLAAASVQPGDKTDRPLGLFVDRRSGSHFNITGRATDGPLKGRTLTWIDGVMCKWFAWSAEHPKTSVHAAKSDRVGMEPGKRPRRGVIVSARDVTPQRLVEWSAAGNQLVTLILDDSTPVDEFRRAADAVAEHKLELRYWVEVARHEPLAREHPRWMASLGMHGDWQTRFPKFEKPAKGQLVKAYPWVPIGYREAFDAQIARVTKLIREKAAGDFRGVLLNDLQGGPAACGCGNLLCRWAYDYGVESTASKLGDDAAPRFVAAVVRAIPGKEIVPVWVTECEDIDLPARLRDGKPTTGLCGDVGCSQGTCPKAFVRQWSALSADHAGPIALLALHKELERSDKFFSASGNAALRGAASKVAEPGNWVRQAVQYVDEVPRQLKGTVIPPARLWLVVQGYDVSAEETLAITRAAESAGVGTILTAKSRIDQSYEPRVVTTKK